MLGMIDSGYVESVGNGRGRRRPRDLQGVRVAVKDVAATVPEDVITKQNGLNFVFAKS